MADVVGVLRLWQRTAGLPGTEFSGYYRHSNSRVDPLGEDKDVPKTTLILVLLVAAAAAVVTLLYVLGLDERWILPPAVFGACLAVFVAGYYYVATIARRFQRFMAWAFYSGAMLLLLRASFGVSFRLAGAGEGALAGTAGVGGATVEGFTVAGMLFSLLLGGHLAVDLATVPVAAAMLFFSFQLVRSRPIPQASQEPTEDAETHAQSLEAIRQELLTADGVAELRERLAEVDQVLLKNPRRPGASVLREQIVTAVDREILHRSSRYGGLLSLATLVTTILGLSGTLVVIAVLSAIFASTCSAPMHRRRR